MLLASTFLLLALLFVPVARGASGGQANAHSTEGFPVHGSGVFTQLLKQYNSLDSLHFRVKVLTTFDYDHIKAKFHGTNVDRIVPGGTGIHSDEGYYELWLAGQKFRIESRPAKNADVHHIAWDDRQMQYFSLGSGMSVSTNLSDGYGSVPIDPLLAPFEMLKDLRGTNEVGHQLMYADLRDTNCQQRLHVYRTNASLDKVVEFPGAELDERSFFYRVHMLSEPFSLPSAIEYIDALGKVIARTRISYSTRNADAAVQCWPQAVVRETYSRNGKLIAQQELTIEKFELGKEINPSTFKIDTRRAARVWDSDQKAFIQRRSAFVERSRGILIALFFLTTTAAFFITLRLRRSGAVRHRGFL